MSPNRKAELQRKLAMAPVPKPPAGLAERIKGDIPHPLQFDVIKERQRFSQSVAFNMRVAASILLLISSLYVVLHLMSRAERSESAATATQVAVLDTASRAAAPAPAAAPPPAQPAAQVAVKQAEKKQADENRPVTQIAEAKPEPLGRSEPVRLRATPPPATTAAGELQGVAGGTVPAQVAESAPARVAEAAPPPPAAVAKAAPAPAAAANMDIVRSAKAEDLALEPKTLFGLPVKKSDAPPRTIRIAPESETKDGKVLLHIAIDAPDASPAAADAKVDIDWRVPHEAVSGFGDAKENAIPARATITATYSITVPPDLGRRSIIAIVHLHYRSVKDGSEKTVTRTIRRGEVGR